MKTIKKIAIRNLISLIIFLKKTISFRTTFLFVGIGSTIWFLIRVIPKPSRAAYPCMRASTPIMSSFILYLVGLTTTAFLFKNAKKTFKNSKYVLTGGLILTGLIIGLLVSIQYSEPTYAYAVGTLENPNTPMGEGKGIYPGRVVWEYNPAATNENMKNTAGDYWSDDKNADQTIISKMVSDGLKNMTGKATDAEAWNAIFKYYNSTHGRGDTGYKAGEKIVIKINLNGAGGAGNINTSPQVCYAILDQLVNKAGVAQSDISIGDPNVSMTAVTQTKCTNFSKVKFWTSVTQSTSDVFLTSDGKVKNKLPQDFIDATYEINIPVLKKHHRAGISIGCKNHFGTLASSRGGAWDYHYSLPSPDATGKAVNGSYGQYRVFVDIMGHKDLGGKTILYLVDGIWGSINWGHPPVKFRIAPFNNDWPSSLFLSQDPVAVESVCLDFLYAEFDFTHPTEGKFVGDAKGPFPHFAGVDDYLHQAADTNNWAKGIKYDPEKDGKVLGSLGTHEHWNDSIHKQYSRNLGLDKGIELFNSLVATNIANNKYNLEGFELKPNYPNPVKNNTIIGIYAPENAHIMLQIFNIRGQLVTTLLNNSIASGNHQLNWKASNSNTGYYICRMTATTSHGKYELSRKILVQ
jgi:hypothetical protein